MSIIMMIMYIFIFVCIARAITKNITNIKNISEKFRNMYQVEGQEGVYDYIKQNQSQKQRENMSFESSIKLNNNPIKEKRGKRSSI